MRQAKDRIEVDLSKPVNMATEEGNCFGREWKPTDKECASCGMSDLCCTLYQKTIVKKRAKSIAKPKTHLDEVYFDINRDKLDILLQEDSVPYMELFELVCESSNCYNAKLVNTWLTIFMKDYNYTNESGILVKKC